MKKLNKKIQPTKRKESRMKALVFVQRKSKDEHPTIKDISSILPVNVKYAEPMGLILSAKYLDIKGMRLFLLDDNKLSTLKEPKLNNKIVTFYVEY